MWKFNNNWTLRGLGISDTSECECVNGTIIKPALIIDSKVKMLMKFRPSKLDGVNVKIL